MVYSLQKSPGLLAGGDKSSATECCVHSDDIQFVYVDRSCQDDVDQLKSSYRQGTVLVDQRRQLIQKLYSINEIRRNYIYLQYKKCASAQKLTS